MREQSHHHQKPTDWVKRGLWLAFIISAFLTTILAIKSCRGGAPDSAMVRGVNPASEPTPTTEIFPELNETRPLQNNANRPGTVKLDMDQTVYVLFSGLDIREWENDAGPGLTDTMILAGLDPEQGTAALISLPRDMWVEMPRYGLYKINQAHMLGEWKAHPGGGPALMMETVGQLLDVQIDYYVQVNFDAFISLVDAVDGVKVNVREQILVDPDPSRDGDMKRLKPGVQVLPGDLALGYVRTRNTSQGDFGRAERQQQVLVSLQKKIFDYQILPRLIRKLPGLYQELSDDVETNLTLKQIATLGWVAKEIDPRQLESTVIAPPLVTAGFNNQGQYILIPDVDSIRKVWSDMLMPSVVSTPEPEATATLSWSEYVRQENASVEVLNGTASPGLAGDTADFLSSRGINITRVDNADSNTNLTRVYDCSGNPHTVDFILELLGLSKSHLYHRSGTVDSVDILIVLGSDWAAENPLP